MQDLSKKRIELLRECVELQKWMNYDCSSKKISRYICFKCNNIIGYLNSHYTLKNRMCNNCKEWQVCSKKSLVFIPFEHQHRKILDIAPDVAFEMLCRKHPDNYEVRIRVNDKLECFEGNSPEKCFDQACEYIFSEGKNDLRKED